MPKLSVLIPIYNEEGNIPELYNRLKEAVSKDFAGFEYEFLFVDDGSADGSFAALQKLHEQDPNVKVIQFSRNFGHHIAVTAGLDHVDGDFVVMMDGDLQDQPEEIIKLYHKLEEGYDVVYAERMNRQFSWHKKLMSNLFNRLIRFLVKEDIVINSTIFRIMRKEVADSLREVREQNRYIIGLIGWVGFKHAAQPVAHGARFSGKTKYNLSKQFALAFNAIFAFSEFFLKLIIKVGFFFIFLALLMIGYTLYLYFTGQTTVTGWASTIIIILLIGGVQIIILGVIGEYLGRTYVEVKRRPLYVIRKFIQ